VGTEQATGGIHEGHSCHALSLMASVTNKQLSNCTNCKDNRVPDIQIPKEQNAEIVIANEQVLVNDTGNLP
jgi:hypothetical protein